MKPNPTEIVALGVCQAVAKWPSDPSPTSFPVYDGSDCPVCGGPKAPGTRNPSRFCANDNGRCRKKNGKYKAQFTRRQDPESLPSSTTAAVALVRLLGKRAVPFSPDGARSAFACWGVLLDEARTAALLSELVEDGVLRETVTPQGLTAFELDPELAILARRYRRRAKPNRSSTKKGAQVAGHDAGGDGFVTAKEGPNTGCTRPSAKRARRRAVPTSNNLVTSSVPAASVSNIAPPHIDGGTTLSLKAAKERWVRELQELLPLSTLPKLLTLTDANGDPVTAEVRRHDRGVSLIFPHNAQLDVYPRGGHINLIAKAESLWTSSFREWATRWAANVSLWVLSTPCPTLGDAETLGWKVRNLELAADFTGLVFGNGDQGLFTGRGKKLDIRSSGFRPDGTIETVQIGGRGRGRLSLATEDKSQAVKANHGCEPSESFYAPTWREYGWDGISNIRRVEVRANGAALVIRNDDGEVFDLTAPAALADETLLHKFWRHATTAICLVQRPADELRKLRVRTAPLDPRWVAVQNAATDDGTRTFRVRRAPARRLAIKEQIEKTFRDVKRGTASLASSLGLSSGVLSQLVREHLRAVFKHAATHSDVENVHLQCFEGTTKVDVTV